MGDGLLMTNRHVAELFAKGLGREALSFIPGQSAAVDFLRERDRPDSLLFQIRRVAMVHPYWDMALLEVDGLASVTPLSLSTAPPGDLRERDVVVVGYPALDPRNAVDVQNTIFAGVFNVKRLQPGKLRDVESIRSFGHPVEAVTHDSSTLGGNSGSAVVDVKTGEVVGLHFAGVYLEANYAVPTHELALDRRVVDAGVNFDAEIAGDAAHALGLVLGRGGPRGARHRARPADRNPSDRDHDPDPERRRELRRGGRGGAGRALPRRRLLGPPWIRRAIPWGSRPAAESARQKDRVEAGRRRLHPPYEHFSVVMHKTRRLALYTASNVDAAPARKQPEPGRDYTRKGLTGPGENDQEKWFIDPRIPAIHQLPDRFFTRIARRSTRVTS